MKAIVVQAASGTDGLVYKDIPDPEAGPDEILVKIRATALNRADITQAQGGYSQPGPKPEFEVLGIEFAGEVAKVGYRAEGFDPGDRVMGLLPGGGYAQMAVTHPRLLARVPDELSWAEAGAVPEVFITAHDALVQVGLASGESVLVHSVGSGVGVAAFQIARVMGAGLVIGTAGSDAKVEKAKALGLDIGINYREEDFASIVRDATMGYGVDVVIDLVGAEYWDRNIRSLAGKGRMVIVGMMGGNKVEADLRHLVMKRLQVKGTILRARPIEEKGAATQAFAKSVIPHLSAGRIKVVVDRVFPLAEAGAALEYLATNQHFGKVVLEPPH